MDKAIIRVLYVSQKPVFPVVDGGTKAMSLFFEALQACQSIELTYAPIVTPKHPNVAIPKHVNPKNVHPLFLSTKLTFSKILGSISQVPFNVIRHNDVLAQQALEKLTTTDTYSWIICDGFYALTLLPEKVLHTHKVMYRSHNLESNYWQIRALQEPIRKRFFFSWIARSMKKFEPQKVALAERVLSISHEELMTLKSWNKNTSVFLPSASPDEGTDGVLPHACSIGFVGDMGWFPNRKAMRYFIDNLWPILRQKVPKVQLALAGKGTESFTQLDQGIQGFGFVNDLAKFYAAQRFLINPIKSGTGFNMKLLEAINFHKPVVTYGSRVLGFEDVSCFLTAESDEDFIARTEKLLNDPDLVQELSASINSVIQRHFNFTDKVQELEKMLHES